MSVLEIHNSPPCPCPLYDIITFLSPNKKGMYTINKKAPRLGRPFHLAAAAAAVISRTAATAAIAKQQDQNDDPPPVVVQAATDTIIIVTHKIYLQDFIKHRCSHHIL